MEPRPTSPVPSRPRNLTDELRPALERLGFTVEVEQGITITLLRAEWTDQAARPVESYQLLYTHFHSPDHRPQSYANLALLRGTRVVAMLVTDTHVEKVAEVRWLLLNNRRYKAARQAALDAGTLLPATQHAPQS